MWSLWNLSFKVAGPSGPRIRLRVWSWSTNEVIDLIMEEKRIKREILFWDLDATILMRSLTQINLGKEMVLWLGLAISQDSNVEIAWNLGDLFSKLQCNSGPIFKGFGWLKMISCNSIGYILRLGLELEEREKINVILTTKWIRGSLSYCLGLMESRYT